MIRTTDSARQELKRLLQTQTDEAGACLRLTSDEGGQLTLIVDVEREGDESIEHEGSRVLVYGKDLADELKETTIDVENTMDGPRLVVLAVPLDE